MTPTSIRLGVAGTASARIRDHRRGLEIHSPGNSFEMNITAAIILGVFVFLTCVLVIAVFIWAVKDGQDDKAFSASAAGRGSDVSLRWSASRPGCVSRRAPS
jgi:nitrogen fixation-related uncharacterized protein